MRALVLTLLCLVACGGEDPSGGGKASSRKAKGSIQVADVTAPEGADQAEPGRVRGRVVFEGSAPEMQPLREIRKECLEAGHAPPRDDRVVLAQDGALAGVVVTIQRAPEAPATTPQPAVVDQSSCIFTPRISAVRAGSEVTFTNSDPVAHNVRVESTRNPPVNQTIGSGGEPMLVRFELAEAVSVKCDIHPWMKAWVHVVDHPWFATSGADGSFELPPLPPGSYGLSAWHEVFGELKLRTLEVPAGASVAVDVTFRR